MKIYYCGMSKFDDFELTNTPDVIYVSYKYPYDSFGNILVEKSLYCETHKCATLNINSRRKTKFDILFLIAS